MWEGRFKSTIVDAEAYVMACYRELGPTASARQAQYRAHFDEGLDEEVMSILRDTAQRGWVAGSDRLRRQIEAALGRRVDRPVRGATAQTTRG